MKSKSTVSNAGNKKLKSGKSSAAKGRFRDEHNIDNNICFVVSPIGLEGTDKHKLFKDALDCIIKPAFQDGDYEINVIRADEI